MPVNRTRVDRELAAVETEHHLALPRWRDLLARVFHGDERLGPAARAELLGVPTRRQALRIGAATIGGAAVLAACGDDDGAPPGTTEGGGGEPDGDLDDEVTTDGEDGGESDVVLANTALSLEVLAVDTYQVLLESELVETSALLDASTLFQSHHAQHREALIALVESMGAEPFTTANPVVRAAIVDPLVFAAAGENDLTRLVHDLEQAAAQTYVFAASTLSTADLRATAMSIGGVEARHAAILDLIAGLGRERPARYPADNPLPSDALVPE